MAIKKLTAPVTKASVPSRQKPDEEPVKKKGGSLAALFDETPAGAGFSAFPPGKYRAFITKFELLEPNEKGQCVQITYTGHEDEEESVANKDMSQFYKLLDAEGGKGQGIGFLKRDLEILGYADVPFTDLEETLERITSEKPEVNINVKQNGQYANAYLEGLAED